MSTWAPMKIIFCQVVEELGEKLSLQMVKAVRMMAELEVKLNLLLRIVKQGMFCAGEM